MSDRRTALLDAAVEQIAKHGVRGMRVEEVARSASVSPALIYHHFGDRSTLLRSALEHIGERADAYTRSRGVHARATLETILVAEIQNRPTVRTNSAAWGELRDSAIFDPELRSTISALTKRWVDEVAALIRLGHEDHSIDASVVPDSTAVQLTALVEGISGRWLAGMLSTNAARRHVAEAVAAMTSGRGRGA